MNTESDKPGRKARDYRARAKETKLAPGHMYELQKTVLRRQVVPRLKAGGRVLDIGCGDGEFTEVLAEGASACLGVDLSRQLIEKARERSSDVVRFEIGDAPSLAVEGQFDAVAMMGLLTTLVDDADFHRAIDHALARLAPDGWLILKDSVLCDGQGNRHFVDGDYEAIYRDEQYYLGNLFAKGLKLVGRYPLGRGGAFNQSVVLYLFRPMPRDLSAPRRRVALFYQFPYSWVNLHSIWEAMCDDPAVDPIVVVLPFLHPYFPWNAEVAVRHLEQLGVPYYLWNTFDFAAVGFSAAVFSSPYESTRPPEYAFGQVARLVPVTAYVPYGLEVGGGAENIAFQYQQPASMHANAVFVRSTSVRQMFAKYCPSGDAHVYVTGHPRMDLSRNLDRFEVDADLVGRVGGRKAVLWNAHFSFGQNMWSSLDRLFDAIIEAFAARPELVLIFRPHPMLWPRMIQTGLFDAAGLARFRAELEAMGVIIDDRIDHRHAFAISSALMSDPGSFLMEYLPTGKPILYLKNPDGLGLNEEGEALLTVLESAESGEAVAAFLDRVISGEDPGRGQRIAAVDTFFAGMDGEAGRRAARVIGNLMSIHCP